MITNVLFKKEQKGLVAGYLPNGKEVYVDVYKIQTSRLSTTMKADSNQPSRSSETSC